MNNILFISLYEPNAYGGRIGGTVILINDILSVLPKYANADLIVYKKDSIKSQLPDNVNFIPWNKIAVKARKEKILDRFKYSPRKDYDCFDIKADGYNKVIFYPYFSSLFNVIGCDADYYTIGMDSGPMLYLRGFLNHPDFKYKTFSLYMFFSVCKIDKHASKISKEVFTVGENDAYFYRSAFLANARFVHHPVSKLINKYNPCLWKAGEKLRICFPGGFTKFYSANLLDGVLSLILKESDYFCERISISFLGLPRYKIVENELSAIKNQGINVNITEFADDFEEYLSQQHLILMPLVVGAGTKNKALSALGMGLDLIGSPIAVENIYGVMDINVARDPQEFISKIKIRLEQHKLYGYSSDKIAEFRKYHDKNEWQKYFWKEIIREK